MAMPSDKGKTVRVGVAALCAAWFKEVGLQDETSDLTRVLQDDYTDMVSFLQECFGQVVAPGIISTPGEASQAGDLFRTEQVDALVLVHMMWNEDQPLLALLAACPKLPLLLWNYRPTGALPPYLTINDLFRYSGVVGMLQGSAPMQRHGVVRAFVSGPPGDVSLRDALRQYKAALRLRSEFHGLRAGRIAGRCEAMVGTWVDPDRLQNDLGVTLIDISAREYAQACERVAPQRIDAYCQELVGRFPVKGVSTESLRLACRNALALDDLVQEHGLGVVGIQDLDPELHQLAGTRPCLCPPACTELGVAFAMEGDVNTGLGLLAGRSVAGVPGMYTEILTYDPRQNILLMGHAAVHDPRLAAEDGATLVPDEEYRQSDRVEGAWFEFVMAPGPVTCVNLYDTGQGYRMTVFEGVSRGGPRRAQGYAHAIVRPDAGVEELVMTLASMGMTQHYGIVPGHVAGALEKWAWLMGIAFRRVS